MPSHAISASGPRVRRPAVAFALLALLALHPAADAAEDAGAQDFDALYRALEAGEAEFASSAEARAYRDRMEALLPADDPRRRHQMDLIRCYFDFDADPVRKAEFARAGLDEAEAGGLVREAVHWLHCLGAALESSEDPATALPPYRDALDRANILGDARLRADGMIAIAGLLSLRGDHGEALALLVESQQLLEGLGRHDEAARLQADIGIAYRRIGRLERAEELLLDALARAELTPQEERAQRYIALMQLGYTLDEQGRHPEALQRFHAALDLAREMEVPFHVASAEMALAWPLIALERHRHALEALQRAETMFESLGDASNRPMLALLRARALGGLGRGEEALILLEEAGTQAAIRDNPRYLALHRDALAAQLAALGRHPEAYAASREYQQLEATLLRSLQDQQLTLLQAQLEVRDRSAEIERLRAEQQLRATEIQALERTRHWQALALAAVSVIVLSLVLWAIRQLRHNRDLRLQASTDPLTRVANRRAFMLRARQLFDEHRARHRPLSVVGVDLDRFKELNDRLGHAAGDEVLAEAAACMQQRLRQDEVLGRLGGEEFAVLLPDTDSSGAVSVAERLRTSIAGLRFDHIAPDLVITISLGVASLDPDQHTELETLLEAADRALYRAKAGGRNQVQVESGRAEPDPVA